MHSRDGNEEKGKKLFETWIVFATLPRSYSILLPVQHKVNTSIFNIITHERSRKERTRTTHIFSTVFIRHLDMTNAFPFPDCFHAHVPLRFCTLFSSIPQDSLRRDHIRLCLGQPAVLFLLCTYHPLHPSWILFIHVASLTRTLDRHLQVKAGIHFFESDLDLIAESDTTSSDSAAACGSCRTFSPSYLRQVNIIS